MRKFFKSLGILLAAILGIVLMLLAMSIRTVDERPFRETEYWENTVNALDAKLDSLPDSEAGDLWAGAGKAGLTPPIGVPLAGYGNRDGAPSEGVHDSLYVRVIAVGNAELSTFIVGYDALLLPPQIAREVENEIQKKLGIESEQIVFTATHTHSGAGGWGNGWLEEQFAGPPDERIEIMFFDSTLVAIERALQNQQPAAYRFGSIQTPRFIRNRLVGDKGSVDAELVYLSLQHAEKMIGLFVTYSAHATVLSARNTLFSGDYPGYLQRQLEAKLGGVTLFAASGLGSHGPRGEGDGFAKAEFIGAALADSLLAHLSDYSLDRTAALAHIRLPLELPRLQVRITQSLTLAPWLAKRLLKPGDAYIQLLMIDDFIIAATPGDYSGELALDVKDVAEETGKMATITSLNGGYIGYLTPSKYYPLNEYETRIMSWYGPFTGDLVTELIKRMIAGLSQNETTNLQEFDE